MSKIDEVLAAKITRTLSRFGAFASERDSLIFRREIQDWVHGPYEFTNRGAGIRVVVDYHRVPFRVTLSENTPSDKSPEQYDAVNEELRALIST